MSEETPDQKRFLSYVEKDETSGCWLWTGHRAITGYCNFFYRGKTFLAHRASLLIFKKVTELTAGLSVSHSCRNRNCVNPAHLSEKTASENNGADKVRDGVDKSGEKCHFATLNWEKVAAIRQLKADEPKIHLKKIAEKYGVTASCISSIVRNKTWITK